MKCVNCGFEFLESAKFCPKCGIQIFDNSELANQSQAAEGVADNPTNQRYLNAFKDNLFLCICIFTSVVSVLQLLSKTLPVMPILFTVFLWLIYTSARANDVNHQMMRCVSGTIFAEKILLIILGALVVLISIISILLMFVATDSLTVLNNIIYEVSYRFGSEVNFDIPVDVGRGLFVILFSIVILILLTVVIVSYLAFNALHKFAKSLYMNAQNPAYPIQKSATAKGWIMFLIICGALSTLGSLGDFKMIILNSANLMIYIFSYILIGKYFNEEVHYF